MLITFKLDSSVLCVNFTITEALLQWNYRPTLDTLCLNDCF